jgi:NodT family efflux transporter outer membrane factor (OMF) lipoprotein
MIPRCRLTRLGIWLIGVAALGFLGCAVGPNFKRPIPPALDRYTPDPLPDRTATADQRGQRFVAGAEVPSEWWKLFGSPALDRTVAEALAHNQNLAAAAANLRATEDTRRAGYGVFLPQIGVVGTAARERNSPRQIGQMAPGSVFNLFTVTGSIGYTLDLFGGARRRLEALGAEVDLARENERAAYLALTANVVNASIARAAYRAEVDATRELIGAATNQANLAEVQFRAGTTGYASVLALKSQVASLETSLPPLAQRGDAAGDLLAVLGGRSPAEWKPPDIAFDTLRLPEDIPVSLPSDLVRQRPDVLAAEADLHAASAQIGIATADILPSISLSGDLGSGAGRIWSGAGSVSVPVFRGGSLWFTRRSAVHAYEKSLAEYRQTVLTAFQQVADTLRALQHDAEMVGAAAQAAQLARDSQALIQANYQAGVASYLAVMTATQEYQNARLTYLQASAQRLQDTVALYVALGGGWWNAPNP